MPGSSSDFGPIWASHELKIARCGTQNEQTQPTPWTVQMTTLFRLIGKILVVAIGSCIVVAATLIFIGGATAVIFSCADSSALRNRAKRMLTPEELETLHSAGGICSDIFVFKRDGENRCLMLDSDDLSCG